MLSGSLLFEYLQGTQRKYEKYTAAPFNLYRCPKIPGTPVRSAKPTTCQADNSEALQTSILAEKILSKINTEHHRAVV